MLAHKLRLGAAILLCTVFLGAPGFAQDVDIHPDMEYNAAMSEKALENLKTAFESLKQGLIALKQGLPPEQGTMVDNVIAIIDTKLGALAKIDVYTVRENTPGEAFEAIRDFYQARMALQEVNSAMLKTQLSAAQSQGVSAEMVQQMFLIPRESIDQLIALIDQNKFQAASGGSGKSRISITTVYVNPLNYEVTEGTTVVIATDR